VWLAVSTAWAADSGLAGLLKAVEQRYNRAQTLQVSFEQRYTAQGRHRVEAGELRLRKPGRMRWQYSNPAGKLFLSDGKFVYFYSPTANRVEKSKLKETEDMRAPLAFLLGKLNFQRDFGAFRATPQGADTVLVARAKNNRLPYTEVEFTVTPQRAIRHLVVRGTDQSVMEYTFSNEKLNPALDDSVFRFRLPPGAEFVESVEEERKTP
jgi:outer membrane lipoprotein carrier protein